MWGSAFKLIFLCGVALAVAGCASPSSGDHETKVATMENGEPSHVTVQHCLVAFAGSVPGKPVTRTRAQAETLANEILAKAQAGEDFNALVKQYTDDSPPGVYELANDGYPSSKAAGIYGRREMVPAFGNTGFPLEVGQYGMAVYDSRDSPFGFHIIKRLK